MIDKKISVSEQVADLPIEAQLIFTWSIPHADDLGLLPKSPRTLRAMVIPLMDDIDNTKFVDLLDKIITAGLYEIYVHTDQSEWLRITKFFQHQTLKRDRKPNTYLKDVVSWEAVEDLDFQMEDDGIPSKEKLSKEKGSKAKRSNSPTNAELQRSFAEFWEQYPRKISKQMAWRAWFKIMPDSKLVKVIMKSLMAYRETSQWRKDGGQFIPHAATWLNQKRWEDEVNVEAGNRTVDRI